MLFRSVRIQKDFFADYFVGKEERLTIFVTPQDFLRKLLSVVDPAFKRAGKQLCKIVDLLSDIYMKVEQGTAPEDRDWFNIAVAEDVYDKVGSVFEKITAIFGKNDIEVERLDKPAFYVGTTPDGSVTLEEDAVPADFIEFEDEQDEGQEDSEEADEVAEANEGNKGA